MEKEKLITLVTKAQRGDTDAKNALFSEFYNVIYDFAYKTLKDENIACDITQETFLEIIRTIGNLQIPEAFVSWAKKIAYHQCTRHFKKKKDVLVDEYDDGGDIFDTIEDTDTAVIPQDIYEQEDLRTTIKNMVDNLSEEQRSAVTLFYFDEMTIAKIAEIQAVSEGTVKSRLNYARKSLRKSVETYEAKSGIRLHSISLAPLFMLGLGSKSVMPTSAFLSTQQAVSAAVAGAAASTAAGTAAAGTTAVAATSATATGVTATVGAGIVAKIVAGVIALAVVTTSTIAIIGGFKKDDVTIDNNIEQITYQFENNPPYSDTDLLYTPILKSKEECDEYIAKLVPNAVYSSESRDTWDGCLYSYSYQLESEPLEKIVGAPTVILGDSTKVVIDKTTLGDLEKNGWTYDENDISGPEEGLKNVTMFKPNKSEVSRNTIFVGISSDDLTADYSDWTIYWLSSFLNPDSKFTICDKITQDSSIEDIVTAFGIPERITISTFKYEMPYLTQPTYETYIDIYNENTTDGLVNITADIYKNHITDFIIR